MTVFVCYTSYKIIAWCTFCHQKYIKEATRKIKTDFSFYILCHPLSGFLSSLKIRTFTFSHFLWHNSSQIFDKWLIYPNQSQYISTANNTIVKNLCKSCTENCCNFPRIMSSNPLVMGNCLCGGYWARLMVSSDDRTWKLSSYKIIAALGLSNISSFFYVLIAVILTYGDALVSVKVI